MSCALSRGWLPFFAAVTVAASPVAMRPADAAGQAAKKLDVSYIPSSAVAATVAHPARVLKSPEFALMPLEVFSAAGLQAFGIDPLHVEQFVFAMEPPDGRRPPGMGVVVRLTRPYDFKRVLPKVWKATEEAKLGGNRYRKSVLADEWSMYMPNGRLLLAGMGGFLEKMMTAEDADSPLLQLMKTADDAHDLQAIFSMAAVRGPLKQALANSPLAAFAEFPDLLSSVQLQLDLGQTAKSNMILQAEDGEKAKRLEEVLNQGLRLARQMALAGAAQMTADAKDDPVGEAAAQYMRRIVNYLFDRLTPRREGALVRISVEGRQSAATVGTLMALLLPAVQAAREAARRTQSANNLRMCALAMVLHDDAHNRFPARANFDDKGKPLLSWRVHILPYLERNDLYEQFRLDERWDSPHNKKLISQMPAIYQNPNLPPGRHQTSYLLVTGKGTLFPAREGPVGSKISSAAETVLLVEADADRAVIWTKPDDLEFDPKNPLAGLGGLRPGGFLAAFADCHVTTVEKNVDPAKFRRWVNPEK